MRIVLLGDSHLARIRRDLPLLGPDVCNAAEGGASARDLLAQATKAAVGDNDLAVVSVGTNDAAPCKQVPTPLFAQAVARCMQTVPAHRWVYVSPPGVDEARLTALAIEATRSSTSTGTPPSPCAARRVHESYAPSASSGHWEQMPSSAMAFT